MSLYKRTAKKIIEILNNRSGFDDWYHNIDKECQKDIIQEITEQIELDFYEIRGDEK